MDRTRGFLNEELEGKSWDGQRAVQAKRLADVVAHAAANAPAIGDLFRKAGAVPGDIRSLEDLARLPVTPKAKLVELPGGAARIERLRAWHRALGLYPREV